MKKSTAINLFIICCMLILSITTITVIYSTVPETEVVIFEENFHTVDENKWSHETAECKEGNENFYYTSGNNENRYAANGTLHFFTNHTEELNRSRRWTQSNCSSCINWQNGGVDCFSSRYSARFQTKSSFDVKCGQIEVRFRLPSDSSTKFSFLIMSVNNDSEEALGGFSMRRTSEDTGQNCSAIVQLFFGPDFNQSIIKSTTADDNFHLYKIKWDDSKVLFSLDQQPIFERVYQKNGNNSCSSEEFDQNAPINQPFYLKMGVDMKEEDVRCHSDHSDRKRSIPASSENSTSLDVDYIRFTQTLS